MRLLLTLLITVLANAALQAQGISDQVIAAFTASYNAESSKDYAKAISDLSGVYSETSYELNLRLGWLHCQKKDYDQSQRYYRQAIRLRPESIEALFGLVSPAAALQNWAEVFSAYQKILAIDANNAVANYRIALMYYYRKEFASAEKHLQRNIAHYPFDYDSILLMAQVKLGLGKTGESKGFYQRALLYNPSNAEIKAIVRKL